MQRHAWMTTQLCRYQATVKHYGSTFEQLRKHSLHCLTQQQSTYLRAFRPLCTDAGVLASCMCTHLPTCLPACAWRGRCSGFLHVLYLLTCLPACACRCRCLDSCVCTCLPACLPARVCPGFCCLCLPT
jgi:hypothetical protein